jgi:DNA polymerase-1
MPAPLLIADIPWLLYRSFFGLPKSIKGTDGKPVNALLGTANALLAAIEAKAPRAVVACFGAEEARYRVELYAPYHAHRDPMPDELRWQWERAQGLLASFGWIVADAGELEADDAMGSYARAESEAGGSGLLLTADRDMYQSVDKHVAVLDIGKGASYSAIQVRDVQERYGVAPECVPDFIALRGDPSDGLPGAPGIGEKTAAELLRKYGTLEALLEQAERQREDAGFGDLRPRVVAALCDNAELLRTFKQVATLVEIDVKRPLDTPTDYAAGAVAARKLGMNRLAERLEPTAGNTP